MKKLEISKTLSLPTDAVTQKLAFIGRTGSGKSYAATKLAELFYECGAQFIAIDPIGIWAGLRIGDGDNKGLEDIIIFGGLRGDFAINPDKGARIADLVTDRNLSVVIDVSQFEFDSQRHKFVNEFANRFFFKKKSSPSPVHLFLEESDEFVPQEKEKGQEKMIHEIQRIAKQGRNFGIGLSLISQRPQAISKKALNQTECLFAFQITGPHERKAIKEWVDAKGINGDLNDILPKLKQGHAHIWSPVWLEVDQEISIAQKKTYSLGSTPKIGDKPVTVKPLAPHEGEKLRADLADIEEKANDPTELKKQIIELKKENAKLLSAKPAVTTSIVSTPKAPPIPKLPPEFIKKAKDREKQIAEFSKKVSDAIVRMNTSFTKGIQEIPHILEWVTQMDALEKIDWLNIKTISIAPLSPKEKQYLERGITPPKVEHGGSIPGKTVHQVAKMMQPDSGDASLQPVHNRVLGALSNLEALGISNVPRIQVAVFSGYSNLSSTGFVKAISHLRSAGYIDYPSSGTMCLTNEGRAVAPMGVPPQSSEELQERFIAMIEPVCGRMLKIIINYRYEPLSRLDLATQTGYTNTSSTGFVKALSRLRSLGLIDYPSTGTCQASSLLFLD
jgi:hypothetical protein